ncbi:hypothetical protein AA13595_0534 [Gluconacetobacter johannae DSM 13595]|nr:hypothetical protein AA13595_0534 [Gluconacetobacter johannae DSM 13595]
MPAAVAPNRTPATGANAGIGRARGDTGRGAAIGPVFCPARLRGGRDPAPVRGPGGGDGLGRPPYFFGGVAGAGGVAGIGLPLGS